MYSDNPHDLTIPGFLQKLIDSVNAGISHQFLLYGNINDYFHMGNRYFPLKHVLKQIFKQRRFVCFYNLALGIHFDDMERRRAFFAELVPASSKYTSGIPRDPEVSLLFLEKALKYPPKGKRQVAVILEYAESLAPSLSHSGRAKIDSIAISRWANDLDIAKRRNIVILITRDKASVSDDLIAGSLGMEVIEIQRPNRQERHDFLCYLNKQHPDVLKEKDIDDIARVSGGLCCHHLENMALKTKARNRKLTKELILPQKIDIINQEYSDIVEVVNPKHGLEVFGGFDYIKDYLSRVANYMLKGDTRNVPMGIIIMGPPGTGKTFLVECFAKECGLLVVKAKNLRDKYVGESEKRQERFHALLKAMAPVIVIIDESEQQQGSRTDQESSQLDNRMRAKNFAFWGDSSNRGRIVRIDITNWPNMIDPAMRRSGRSDAKIPILFPSPADRVEIAKAIIGKHKLSVKNVKDAFWMDRFDHYTPANLEQVILIAHEFATSDNREVITHTDLVRAVEDFLLPRYNQEEVERMTLAALEEASRRSLMPENAEEIMERLRLKYG